MTRLTADPILTCVAAAGFSLITLPEGTVLLDRPASNAGSPSDAQCLREGA
jgi:hypothetical protein